jgi:hypothetical protein
MADGLREINAIKTVLHQSNLNLLTSQKELLLWHQRLSHASINWIQTLMQDRLWLPVTDNGSHALHPGPLLPTKSRMPTCDTLKQPVSTLKPQHKLLIIRLPILL